MRQFRSKMAWFVVPLVLLVGFSVALKSEDVNAYSVSGGLNYGLNCEWNSAYNRSDCTFSSSMMTYPTSDYSSGSWDDILCAKYTGYQYGSTGNWSSVYSLSMSTSASQGSCSSGWKYMGYFYAPNGFMIVTSH